jgi:hypothetical protein
MRVRGQPVKRIEPSAKIDIMKWTTFAVAALIVVVIILKIKAFIKKRKKGGAAKTIPILKTLPPPAASGSPTAPAAVSQSPPAAVSQSPPAAGSDSPKHKPNIAAPAAAHPKAAPKAKAPPKAKAAPRHPTGEAANGPIPSLDDELEGFLGQMQKDEKELRTRKQEASDKSSYPSSYPVE